MFMGNDIGKSKVITLSDSMPKRLDKVTREARNTGGLRLVYLTHIMLHVHLSIKPFFDHPIDRFRLYHMSHFNRSI